MNKIITSVIAALGFITSVGVPLTARAETTVFSDTGAFVETVVNNTSCNIGTDNVAKRKTISLSIRASNNASRSQSAWTNTSGWLITYVENTDWMGLSDNCVPVGIEGKFHQVTFIQSIVTTEPGPCPVFCDFGVIDFKATGSVPNNVIVSGEGGARGASCFREGGEPERCHFFLPSSLKFYINAHASSNNVTHNKNVTHSDDGIIKINVTEDVSESPAVFDNSFISIGDVFGGEPIDIVLASGNVGISKLHQVEIIQ